MPAQARSGNQLHTVWYTDTDGAERVSKYNRETLFARVEDIAATLGNSVITRTEPPELAAQIEAFRAEAQAAQPAV